MLNKKVSTNIKYTKFVDADRKSAKTYDVKDGVLTKVLMGNFYNGTFETISEPITDLPKSIQSMMAGEFVVQGLHETLISGNCPDDATRSKELFPFSTQAGLLVIDSDALNAFDGIATLPDLVNALHEIEPALATALAFCSSSGSSYIKFKDTDTGFRGAHTFIPINQTLSNADILECLHVRSVIHGFAHTFITLDGKILVKSLIDTALKSSNQPIFEGGAILLSNEISQNRQFHLHEGTLLDSSSITPITKHERLKFDAIVKSMKDECAGEADEKRKLYKATKKVEMKSKTDSLNVKHSDYVVDKAMAGSLYGPFTIRLHDNQIITVQDILDNKEKYHGVGCAHPLEDDIFGKSIIYSNQAKPVIHTFVHGGEIYDLKMTQSEWGIDLCKHVDVFNETHAQVIVGGKHRIMRQVPAEIQPETRYSYEFIALKELKLMYENEPIQVGGKKIGDQISPIFNDKMTAWSSNQNCKKYTGGVVFSPSKTLGSDYYNMWRGFAVEPQDNAADTTLVTQHIEQIICDNDPALIDYLYNWIAYTVQYPDKPARAAPVLYGEKGVGKGLFGHFLCSLWGNHAVHISTPKHLSGDFNGHLADVCFVFADEAVFAGDKKNEGKLKALITEPRIMIERKGIDAVSQNNYLKILMATNNEFAVPATKDERRYCVLEVSNARLGDKRYFDALEKVTQDKKVQATFLYDMLNRDISDFSPSAIPETEGLKTQRMHSLNSVGKWLVDSLSNGGFSSDLNSIAPIWCQQISSTDLYESYSAWTKINRTTSYESFTQNALGRYLKKIYKVTKLKTGRCYVLGTLQDAIEQFERYEKVTIDPLPPEMGEGDLINKI
jgi:hypothetical protein